ncbi:MAG: DegT/DnrJ/EryC1/StrS family aminotransferase, partial [Candidatus Omnitrophica bacterium]|nr:DegT/DnrJ/EryC1/StrS family aminotransferase [Candidatus Omnitrophota bacterium]
ACKYSDMTVFSFHPVKIITTGEGGAITTNSKQLYEKLLSLRSHGIYKDKKNAAAIGGWYYEMRDLGFNYRITDLQCALGITQLEKIKKFLKRREAIASFYSKELQEFKRLIKLPFEDRSISRHAWHLYVLRFNLENIRCSRKEIYTMLQKKNIGVQVHYIPVHTQPFYRKHGYGKEKYPMSEKYYSEALSLPICPDLSDTQLRYVIRSIQEILRSVAR